MRYLIIDSQNLFYRAIHIAGGSQNIRAGLAVHIMLTSMAAAWRLFKADHVVFALECRTNDNWRKLVDKRYKFNRQELREAMKPKEKEEMEFFYNMYNECLSFLKNDTNVSVLQCPIAEADDMIAHWIHRHPGDDHVIVSSDKDFQQLLADNVVIFNGIDNKIFTSQDSKLAAEIVLEDSIPRGYKMVTVDDPEYFLFEKIVRGDAGDNVFSAFPGVRKNSGANKPGIIKAYEDRVTQGYEWNNFMMSHWTDHNGDDHLVKDCFLRNKQLVDLNAQPDYVVDAMDESLEGATSKDHTNKVGFKYFQFCNRHNLDQLADRGDDMIQILAAPYRE